MVEVGLGGQRVLQGRAEHWRALIKRSVSSHLPNARDVRVTGLHPPAGQGLSNETYLLGISYRLDGARIQESLVARCRPNAGIFETYDLSKQFRIMQSLSDTKIPVPKMVWIDGTEGGDAFFLMERVEGQIPPEGWFAKGVIAESKPAVRAQIGKALIETLIRLHEVDWESLGLDWLEAPEPGSMQATDRELKIWEWRLRWSASKKQPLLEDGLAWLKANRPVSAETVLLHGDCKPSNYMFRGGRCVAVLDWELARLGDPSEDLGWYLAHRYRDGAPPKGYPDRPKIIALYERISGRRLVSVEFNEAFALFKFIVIGLMFVRRNREIGLETEEPLHDQDSQSPFVQGLLSFIV